MTTEEKARVYEMRSRGMGYKSIAKELGVTDNVVSSYCRRNHLDTASLKYSVPCQNCGQPVRKAEKQKQRKFCSDACRITWWNAHRDLKKKRAPYTFSCVGCGRTVESYGNHKRKYCCHSCYLCDRYGWEEPHDE